VTTLNRQASAAAARAAKARTASGGDDAAAADDNDDDDDDADDNADGNGASIGVSATRLPATYKFLKALETNQEQEERAARARAHGGGSRAASAGAAASASALSYRDDDGGYGDDDDDVDEGGFSRKPKKRKVRPVPLSARGGGSRTASAGAAASAGALSYRDDNGGYDDDGDDEGIDAWEGGRMGMPVGGAAGRLPPASRRGRVVGPAAGASSVHTWDDAVFDRATALFDKSFRGGRGRSRGHGASSTSSAAAAHGNDAISAGGSSSWGGDDDVDELSVHSSLRGGAAGAMPRGASARPSARTKTMWPPATILNAQRGPHHSAGAQPGHRREFWRVLAGQMVV
jgi:hypothetical protein